MIKFKKKKHKGIRSKVAIDIVNAYGDIIDNKLVEQMKLFINCHSIKGAIELCKNEEIVASIGENKFMIFMRAVSGWI